jgi:hypothetical protein
VKYVLLVYSNPASWDALSEEERKGLMSEYDAFNKELEDSGVLVGGAALAEPAESRAVRVRDGVPATTDGPFAEAKEHLAGYYVIDCESLEQASEIAARDPGARLGAIVVRAIVDSVGADA